jgi:hypothetical protein
MDFSPESEAIEAAINAALPHLEGSDDRDILIDWVVIAYVTNPDPEEGSGYPMMFSNGNMPSYRAIGLLNMAMIKVEQNLG